jgi:hypothetical protein
MRAPVPVPGLATPSFSFLTKTAYFSAFDFDPAARTDTGPTTDNSAATSATERIFLNI